MTGFTVAPKIPEMVKNGGLPYRCLLWRACNTLRCLMLIARYKHVWRVERSLENRSMTTTDIKAVFFDIDGTLTSFVTHKVPDSTVEAIQRLQSAGIKVLICTGRAPSQMKVVLDTMPISFDGIQWSILF